MPTKGRPARLMGLLISGLSFKSELRRSFISIAALLVKVTAKIFSGATPLLIKFKILSVMVLVLPAPAPAKTKSGPSNVSTAIF